MSRMKRKRAGLPVQRQLPLQFSSVPPQPPPKRDEIPATLEFPDGWQTSIEQIRRELETDDWRLLKKLEEHERVRIAGRGELEERANILRVGPLLEEMNKILLSGDGLVQEKFRWYLASDFDLESVDEDKDEEVAVPVLSIELYWKEGRRLQFDVELVGTGDDVLLYVNGNEMPAADPLFLQAELIRSFKEQMYDA